MTFSKNGISLPFVRLIPCYPFSKRVIICHHGYPIKYIILSENTPLHSDFLGSTIPWKHRLIFPFMTLCWNKKLNQSRFYFPIITMSSLSITVLMHRCESREAEALQEVKESYTRGMAALDEKRLDDAVRELKHCRNFMEFVDLFASQQECFKQMLQDNPSDEKLKEHMERIMELLQ
jgi:hypothetical protein